MKLHFLIEIWWSNFDIALKCCIAPNVIGNNCILVANNDWLSSVKYIMLCFGTVNFLSILIWKIFKMQCKNIWAISIALIGIKKYVVYGIQTSKNFPEWSRNILLFETFDLKSIGTCLFSKNFASFNSIQLVFPNVKGHTNWVFLYLDID